MEKQEIKGKNKLPGRMKGMIRGLFVLLAAVLVYVGVVLLESPEARQDESWAVLDDEAVTPIQAATLSDVQALARLFGAPLPAFSGIQPVGEARNATHDGKSVRQVTLKYNGAVITAVRPASAAPLLLQEDMSISLRSDLTAINLPAVLAEKDGSYCLYFSSGQAAYSLTAEAKDTETFLDLARKLTIVQ